MQSFLEELGFLIPTNYPILTKLFYLTKIRFLIKTRLNQDFPTKICHSNFIRTKFAHPNEFIQINSEKAIA